MCRAHDQSNAPTHPVNGVSRGDARPREGRVSFGALCRVVPADAASPNGLPEFRQAVRAGPKPPAKIVHDEALDAGDLSGIDHGNLMFNSRWTHGAYDGILALQRLGKVLYRVGGPDDGQSRWKGGAGVEPGDDGYVKAAISG